MYIVPLGPIKNLKRGAHLPVAITHLHTAMTPGPVFSLQSSGHPLPGRHQLPVGPRQQRRPGHRTPRQREGRTHPVQRNDLVGLHGTGYRSVLYFNSTFALLLKFLNVICPAILFYFIVHIVNKLLQRNVPLGINKVQYNMIII